VFSTPRSLPQAAGLPGRVVVLDIAFAADGMGTPFEEVTGAFLRDLGDRLAAWVDHHDHELHARFADDPRFLLRTKAQHGACPEMITPALVAAVGPVDTILTHVDLDGLYAAAKWILGGHEPYPGADDDARAVDTRLGEPGPTGKLIDFALRARFRDTNLKHRIVQYLIARTKAPHHWEEIEEAARLVDPLLDEAKRQADRYRVDGQVAYVRPRGGAPYDKTELLLLGQEKAAVAVVQAVAGGGVVAVAAVATARKPEPEREPA